MLIIYQFLLYKFLVGFHGEYNILAQYTLKTPRKFIIAELSIRNLGSSRRFIYKKGVNSNSRIISTDEDPSLRIECSAVIIPDYICFKTNAFYPDSVVSMV